MALLNAIRHVWVSKLQLVQMQKKSPVKKHISVGLGLLFPLFANSMGSFLALVKNTAPTQRFKFELRGCFLVLVFLLWRSRMQLGKKTTLSEPVLQIEA